MKRELLISFPFHGREIYVYVVPKSHLALRNPESRDRPYWGVVFYDEGEIYIQAEASEEARRMLIAHEIQHLIEERLPVNHLHSAKGAAESDERTNLLAEGWLYLLQHCPDLCNYLAWR